MDQPDCTAWTVPNLPALYVCCINGAWAASQAESTHDSEYYIGTVISHEEKKNELQLIDGQQRVTSIVLILASYIMWLKETNANDDHIAEYRGIIKKFYDGKKDTKISKRSVAKYRIYSPLNIGGSRSLLLKNAL
mgnify:CR=1 FL=1